MTEPTKLLVEKNPSGWCLCDRTDDMLCGMRELHFSCHCVCHKPTYQTPTMSSKTFDGPYAGTWRGMTILGAPGKERILE